MEPAVGIADNDATDGPLYGGGAAALQQQANLVGNEEADDGADERTVLQDLDEQFERHLQAVADEVGGAGQGQVEKEQERGHPYGRAQRPVAGPVEEVVGTVVVE